MIELLICFICGIAVGINIGRWIFIKIAKGWEEIAYGYKELYQRKQYDCTCPTIDGVPVTGAACEVHGMEGDET